jgi:hypothetical protein
MVRTLLHSSPRFQYATTKGNSLQMGKMEGHSLLRQKSNRRSFDYATLRSG